MFNRLACFEQQDANSKELYESVRKATNLDCSRHMPRLSDNGCPLLVATGEWIQKVRQALADDAKDL